jgi:hypothetical protein
VPDARQQSGISVVELHGNRLMKEIKWAAPIFPLPVIKRNSPWALNAEIKPKPKRAPVLPTGFVCVFTQLFQLLVLFCFGRLMTTIFGLAQSSSHTALAWLCEGLRLSHFDGFMYPWEDKANKPQIKKKFC